MYNAFAKPTTPAGRKVISIRIAGKDTGVKGYIENNQTHAVVADVIKAAGGNTTGHGDYINITLPKISGAELDQVQKELIAMQKELTGVKKDLASAKAVIENVRRALP